MFRYVLLMCLWLSVNAEGDFDWTGELVAPEMRKFTVTKVLYKQIEDNNGKNKLSIRLQTHQYDRTDLDTDCTLELESRPDIVAMNISTFRRVGEISVALAWYDEKAYGHKRDTRITLANIKTCSYMTILYVQGKDPIKNPIVVASPANTLDVFIDDENRYCETRGKSNSQCRYSYPLEPLGKQSIMTFDVDLDWPSIRIEPLASRDFIVRGFHGKDYKVMRMSHSTGELRELMRLQNADWQLEMISSNLTFCWIERPGHDKTVNCRQFNDQNEEIYSQETSFDLPMTLMAIESDYEGMIGFFAARFHCSSRENCWHFTKKNLYRSGNGPHPSYAFTFKCEGLNRKAWVTFGFNATSGKWPNVCALSGDVSSHSPECHRDVVKRLYCRKNCISF